MSFLSNLKSLFSSSEESEATIEYDGFNIVPTPIREGAQFRVSATITKGEGESLQTHKFIRSDVIASRDECITHIIRKAKIAIDQRQDSLFK